MCWSVAATRSDHHVPILLQNDIGAIVEIQHGDAVELSGGAARLRDRVWVYKVNLQEQWNSFF